MRGRKPKPTKLKILQGTFRPDRHTGAEADPDVVLPDPPKSLNKVAKAKWLELTRELYSCGLLTTLDVDALENYCVLYARWLKAEEDISKNGLIYKTPSGAWVQTPFVGISNRTLDIMNKIRTDFGMTPVARTRARATPPKKKGEDNPFAQFKK